MAKLVWDRLGDVDNYLEPFCGSLAVMLARPTPPKVETVNDLDCYLANFWRATQHDPEAVVEYVDNPVNEADMHARHRWLVLSDEAKVFRERMRTDPDYYDPRVAGWWCWGACCWIGSGWCATKESAEWSQTPKEASGLTGVHKDSAEWDARPAINKTGGTGVVATLPIQRPVLEERGVVSRQVLSDTNRPQLADAYDIGRGVNASHKDVACQRPQIHGADSGVTINGGGSTCAARRLWLLDWFGRLRDRLRLVRVCCGDWSRICSSSSTTTRLGTTGVFLDPPYSVEADRCNTLYAQESGTVAHDVRKWCLEWGAKPGMRICLAGYVGEGHEELERNGWDVVAWKSNGGYGNRSKKGKDNARKERLWFSPGCQQPKQSSLFDEVPS